MGVKWRAGKSEAVTIISSSCTKVRDEGILNNFLVILSTQKKKKTFLVIHIVDVLIYYTSNGWKGDLVDRTYQCQSALKILKISLPRMALQDKQICPYSRK